MGELVYISESRRRIAAKKGFDPWMRRFGISGDENTTIRVLDNYVVSRLALGDEDSSTAFYELIMGIKGLGYAPRFRYLDTQTKMGVTDITLFLLDLVRFEAMYRLGWLENYPALEVPLVDLVQNFQNQFSVTRHIAPPLSRNHPLYEKYEAEFGGDRHSFVRKLVPEAVKTFRDMEDDAET